jgi:hypothetical protein
MKQLLYDWSLRDAKFSLNARRSDSRKQDLRLYITKFQWLHHTRVLLMHIIHVNETSSYEMYHPRRELFGYTGQYSPRPLLL